MIRYVKAILIFLSLAVFSGCFDVEEDIGEVDEAIVRTDSLLNAKTKSATLLEQMSHNISPNKYPIGNFIDKYAPIVPGKSAGGFK